MLKEDGLERLTSLLALSSLLSLCLLELELDVGSLGELLVADGVGHAGPEVERLVGCLLLGWRQDLGGDVERSNIDDDVLIFFGDVFLSMVSVCHALHNSKEATWL